MTLSKLINNDYGKLKKEWLWEMIIKNKKTTIL